jgi:hypothetical protein
VLGSVSATAGRGADATLSEILVQDKKNGDHEHVGIDEYDHEVVPCVALGATQAITRRDLRDG